MPVANLGLRTFRKRVTAERAHSRKQGATGRAIFRRSVSTVGALLDASPLEEAGIGRILLDVGGIALLRPVSFSFVFAIILIRFSVVRPLMATIG